MQNAPKYLYWCKGSWNLNRPPVGHLLTILNDRYRNHTFWNTSLITLHYWYRSTLHDEWLIAMNINCLQARPTVERAKESQLVADCHVMSKETAMEIRDCRRKESKSSQGNRTRIVDQMDEHYHYKTGFILHPRTRQHPSCSFRNSVRGV